MESCLDKKELYMTLRLWQQVEQVHIGKTGNLRPVPVHLSSHHFHSSTHPKQVAENLQSRQEVLIRTIKNYEHRKYPLISDIFC